jgi:hypothetical protein
MNWIHRYLQVQGLDYIISGALIFLFAFTAYYVQAYYGIGNGAQSTVFSFGCMVGVFHVFFGLGKLEKNKRIKYLVYYPIAWFFGMIYLTYIGNMYFDFFLHTNKMNLVYIITYVICLNYYFLKL